jgi:hypothetical protein
MILAPSAPQRLDLTRVRQVFGLTPATWQSALASELDELAGG